MAYTVTVYAYIQFLSQNEYRFNFDIDLKDLKRALDLSEDSYPEYRDFKSSILKPHIDLINEKTELSVQFKAVKKKVVKQAMSILLSLKNVQ